MMMSGSDCVNRNVFSRWRKVEIDGDDWTWRDKGKETRYASTTRDSPWSLISYNKVYCMLTIRGVTYIYTVTSKHK